MSNSMLIELKKMLNSQTAKSSGIVFGGNILNAALGFAAMLIVARALGPSKFGVFSVATAVMAVSAGLADLGIGTGLVRFSSQALKQDERQAMRVFKAAFNIELVISVIVLVAGWLSAPWLSGLLGKDRELILPLRLAFVGASMLSMGSFVTAVFQSWQKFLSLSIVNVATNLMKLIIIVSLIQMTRLTEVPAVAAYAAAPVFGLILGFAVMPKQFINEPRSNEMVLAYSQLLSFSKWIMYSYLINSLIARVDIFILTRMRGMDEVGLYSAGFQLAQIFPILIGSLVTVLLPQVSRMNKGQEFKAFIGKSVKMSAILIIILLPAFFGAGPVIKAILPQYLGSIAVFKILFGAFMINIIFNPLSTILYAINRPNVLTLTNLLQLLTAIAANIILIPILGALGAAYAFVIWTTTGAIIVCIALIGTRSVWME